MGEVMREDLGGAGKKMGELREDLGLIEGWGGGVDPGESGGEPGKGRDPGRTRGRGLEGYSEIWERRRRNLGKVGGNGEGVVEFRED